MIEQIHDKMLGEIMEQGRKSCSINNYNGKVQSPKSHKYQNPLEPTSP